MATERVYGRYNSCTSSIYAEFLKAFSQEFVQSFSHLLLKHIFHSLEASDPLCRDDPFRKHRKI